MEITLHCGDCLEVMRGMADKSVDAVITDPPYGINYQSARRIDKADRFAVISGDDALSMGWIAEAHRIISDNAPGFCFSRWDVTRGAPPKPVGCAWARMEYKSHPDRVDTVVTPDIRGAECISVVDNLYDGPVYDDDREGY